MFELRSLGGPGRRFAGECCIALRANRSAQGTTGQGEKGFVHLLETAVFIELQRRQADISYVKTPDGYEVDFLARHPDNSEELIQVCTSIDDPGTLAREVRALQDAANEYPRAKQLILTLESRLPFPAVPPPIQVLPAWQWMLQAAEF